MFNNDIVGNSANTQGFKDKKQIRLFSDPADTTKSRELARFTEWAVRQELKNFKVKLIYRSDRFGRGGDHTPFMRQGFNAVRFCEVWEDFTKQHNDQDTPEHVDKEYLRNAARANLVAMAALANAKPAPERVRIDRRQGNDTRVTWTRVDGVEYVLYHRNSSSPAWEKSIEVGNVGEYTVKGVNKDDNTFAIGAKGGLPVEAT